MKVFIILLFVYSKKITIFVKNINMNDGAFVLVAMFSVVVLTFVVLNLHVNGQLVRFKEWFKNLFE